MDTWLPPDPDLPGAVDLLGDGGRAMVARFLSDAGWSPGAIDPVQAFYRPGRCMTVRYDVKARHHDGALELLTLGAECRAGDPVQVWAFPDDPGLPGLPAALEYPEEAGGGQPELLRYRPRRRAVLRYRFPAGHVLFGKVLSPTRAGRALAAARGLNASSGTGVSLALPTAGPAPGTLLLAPLA
ncbi:MAG: hypothetical protein ACRDZ3_07430, partial [Acidimicrobiia bacterium]